MYKYKHREARNQRHVAQNDRAGGSSNHKDSWIIKCKQGFIKKKQKQKNGESPIKVEQKGQSFCFLSEAK